MVDLRAMTGFADAGGFIWLLLAVLIVLPIGLIGIKRLLQQVLAEQRRTNQLLSDSLDWADTQPRNQ